VLCAYSAFDAAIAGPRDLIRVALSRKYHGVLNDEFQVRACRHPNDAGLALKKLIQRCGYSRIEDESYRSDLHRESFNAMLSTLEAISPADAAVARSGIGWSPRGDI
jgi:hypothetical protein